MRNFPQFIKFGIYATAYHIAAVSHIRGIGIDFMRYAVANYLTRIQLLAKVTQHIITGRRTQLLHRLNCRQCILQLHQFPGSYPPNGHLRYEPFHIAYHFKLAFKHVARLGVAEEILHHVKPVVYLPYVFKREQYPPPQHSRPHRRECPVNDRQQALPVFTHRTDQFKIANGKLVEPYISFLFYSRQCGYMAHMCVLSYVKVA